jgi:hypothetical protein
MTPDRVDELDLSTRAQSAYCSPLAARALCPFNAELQAQAVRRFAYQFGRRFDRRDAMDNPEPCAPRQATLKGAASHNRSVPKQRVDGPVNRSHTGK